MDSELSPSKLWSPHQANLNRRRKVTDKEKNTLMDSLGNLNFKDGSDDDEEEYDYLSRSLGAIDPKMSAKASSSPPKRGRKPKKDSTTTKKASLDSKTKGATTSTTKKKATKKTMKTEEETQEEFTKMLQSLPPSIKKKLQKYIDPKTPMKERLEIEVEMMRNPDEKAIFSDFRFQYDRKAYLVKKALYDEEIEGQMAKNLSEEAKRAEEERKELARKKEEKLQEAKAKKEREKQLEQDVKRHKAKTWADSTEEIRKEAERTKQAAIKNKERKVKKEKEYEKKVEKFRKGEGKNMTDVERVLKEAIIEQRET